MSLIEEDKSNKIPYLESSVGDPGKFGADPDPHRRLMDPDPTPDPTPFYSDIKVAKQTQKFSYLFLHLTRRHIIFSLKR